MPKRFFLYLASEHDLVSKRFDVFTKISKRITTIC